MCGICGAFENQIGLVVDKRRSMQPVSERGVHVVFCGTIYNATNLQYALEEEGHLFHTDSPAELIVNMYFAHGSDFVRYLRGTFVIVMFDESKNRLYLYRDRFGEKTMYYKHDNTSGKFLFSTDISLLAANDNTSGGTKGRMSVSQAKAACNYLQYHAQLAPDTCYEHICELAPATKLSFQNGIIKKEIYYTPPYLSCPPGTDLAAMEYENRYDECDAIAMLGSCLAKAIDERLKADEPVGILLSGGLDSSYIAAMAAKLGSAPLFSYTLRYQCDAAASNEKNKDVCAAEYLAKRLGTFHTTYTVTGQEALDSLKQIAKVFGQPYSAGMSLYWLLERLPQKQHVLLTGDGADEAFWGYPFHELVYACLYQNDGEADENKETGHRCMLPAIPPACWEMLLTKTYKEQLYSGSFWETDDDISLEHFAERANRHYYEKLLPGQVFRYVDTFSRVFDKQIRTPYMDQRVVECALNIPVWMKMRNKEPKYLLKRMASGILPARIINRTKETFLPPVALWLTSEWKEFVLDMLSYERLKVGGRFSPAAVYYLMAKFYEQPEQNSRMAEIILSILMYELWYQR